MTAVKRWTRKEQDYIVTALRLDAQDEIVGRVRRLESDAEATTASPSDGSSDRNGVEEGTKRGGRGLGHRFLTSWCRSAS